jgi:hypothetical protein
MPIWPREPDDDAPITSVLILLDTLSPPERRDLANSLLRAALCATLEQTRALLLDALVEIDDAVFGGAACATAPATRSGRSPKPLSMRSRNAAWWLHARVLGELGREVWVVRAKVGYGTEGQRFDSSRAR